jgi:hypothetical protein
MGIVLVTIEQERLDDACRGLADAIRRAEQPKPAPVLVHKGRTLILVDREGIARIARQ